MEVLIQGDIVDFIPFFNVKVEEGNLIINKEGDLFLIVLGKVIIKDFEVETWFIPGDWLLGMEFLSVAGQQLSLNFEDYTVKLLQ